MTPVPTRFRPGSGTECQTRPDPGSPVPDPREGTGERVREAVRLTGPPDVRQEPGAGAGRRPRRPLSPRIDRPQTSAARARPRPEVTSDDH